MSKTKKFTTAIASILLASTMCFTFAACVGDDDETVSPGGDDSSSSSTGLTQSQDLLSVSTDENGELTWSDDLSLSLNMGQSSSVHLAFTSSNIGAGYTATLLDGKDYSQGSLKPAWQSLSDKLGVTLLDNFNDGSSNTNSTRVDTLISDGAIGNYAMVTGTAEQIVNAGSGTGTFLDLSLYLDYMPNFKAFLEENPATYMSLTSSTTTGAIYYAPYYDGNDDIEKYELMNQHWVTALLDSTTTGDSTTFAAQASAKSSAQTGSTDGTTPSVESYMGTEGSWTIETTDPENPTDEDATVTITVSYDNALDAAKTSGTALNTALTAAGVSTSSLTSGNIVDLQNAAIIATNGAVTGAQLLNILRAYIDVAYLDSNGNTYYSTPSDVFNGDDAAWDVDLLVGYMRCLVTNTSLLPDTDLTASNYSLVYGIMARQGNMQRQSDIQSLAGELYGVRGLTSRYNYSYVDSDGVLQDARADEESYDAMDKMNDMATEGLLYTGTSQSAGNTSFYTSSSTPVAGMIYDYVQTQTANGGFAAQGVTTSSYNIPDGYNFSPIVTPVSKWNDGDTSTTANSDGITYSYDSDGNKYMRFTESWRSVKNTGFAIPYDYVKNNPDALAACLAIIDYMFSNDGQILMTYGDVSSVDSCESDGDGTYTSNDDGWWYADDVTDDVDVDELTETVGDQLTIKDEYKSTYFVYDGHVYTNGTYYKGEMQPTMTTASLMLFYGYEVNGLQVGQGASTADNPIGNISVSLSYTNYARNIIGSAQPMGYKLQSFEYQCTAQCGLDGADIVSNAIVNGTISHVSTDPYNDKGMWYFIVPTSLPYESAESQYISSYCDALNNTLFTMESGSTTNYYWSLICYGYGSGSWTFGTYTLDQPTDAAAAISALSSDYALTGFEGVAANSFSKLMTYYDTYILGKD